MSLMPFAFNPTTPATPEGRNWRVFDDASKTIVKTDLTMTTAVSDPVVVGGYFTLYGPIVFYNVRVTLDTNDGWGAGTSYITMPFSALNYNGLNLAQSAMFAMGASGTIVRSVVYLANANPNRLYFTTAYTNGTGADEEVFISGWYFRN